MPLFARSGIGLRRRMTELTFLEGDADLGGWHEAAPAARRREQLPAKGPSRFVASTQSAARRSYRLLEAKELTYRAW